MSDPRLSPGDVRCKSCGNWHFLSDKCACQKKTYDMQKFRTMLAIRVHRSRRDEQTLVPRAGLWSKGYMAGYFAALRSVLYFLKESQRP